jgi:cytochrome c oxidase assembly protein subunit 11
VWHGRKIITKHATSADLKSHSLTLRLIAFVGGMFLFGVFALPPLYDVFCEVTGLGGKTNSVAMTNVDDVIDESRELKLEFVTTVNQYAPWEFRAAEDGMKIHPGQLYEATFLARNTSNSHKIAQAVPSVSPSSAAKYLKKLECFCFTAQEFTAGEEKEMAVRFLIDSDLPEYIDTITLSYTLFDATNFAAPVTVSQDSRR